MGLWVSEWGPSHLSRSCSTTFESHSSLFRITVTISLSAFVVWTDWSCFRFVSDFLSSVVIFRAIGCSFLKILHIVGLALFAFSYLRVANAWSSSGIISSAIYGFFCRLEFIPFCSYCNFMDVSCLLDMFIKMFLVFIIVIRLTFDFNPFSIVTWRVIWWTCIFVVFGMF